MPQLLSMGSGGNVSFRVEAQSISKMRNLEDAKSEGGDAPGSGESEGHPWIQDGTGRGCLHAAK